MYLQLLDNLESANIVPALQPVAESCHHPDLKG